MSYPEPRHLSDSGLTNATFRLSGHEPEPGAPREDYFETLGQVARGLQLSDEEKTAFYLRHDTYWR